MSIYKNKRFTDLSSGRVVEVTDQFEDIVILDNKSKIKLNNLLDNRMYDEYIDPLNFFRNEGLVNAFTEKIRQLPNEVSQDKAFDSSRQLLNNYGNPLDYVDNTPAVLPYDPEEEKQQLIEKAKRMFSNTQNNTSRQMESFKNILGDDELYNVDEENDIDIDRTEPPLNDSVISQPKVLQPMNEQIMSQPPATQPQQSMDPIIQMFRNVIRFRDLILLR